MVREEIIEEDDIQTINTYFMDNKRSIENITIRITKQDNTIIKEYL